MVRSQAMAETTIAGLARKGGVGVETVRYYQRRGLLDMPERTGGDGPRRGYTPVRRGRRPPLAIHPFRPGGRIHARADPRADRAGCGRGPGARPRARQRTPYQARRQDRRTGSGAEIASPAGSRMRRHFRRSLPHHLVVQRLKRRMTGLLSLCGLLRAFPGTRRGGGRVRPTAPT